MACWSYPSHSCSTRRGKPLVAIGITKALDNYDYGGGTAMEVLAIGLALAVVALVWGLFKVLARSGWRRMDARECPMMPNIKWIIVFRCGGG